MFKHNLPTIYLILKMFISHKNLLDTPTQSI